MAGPEAVKISFNWHVLHLLRPHHDLVRTRPDPLRMAESPPAVHGAEGAGVNNSLFFKWGLPGLFFLYFCLFNTVDSKQMFNIHFC